MGQLPYGLQKRVELARALAAAPKLLLLDEPMAGMSFEEKEEMSGFIREVNRTLGTTIVLIEHDMGVVMDLSDHIVVLDNGRKIGDGAPAEVRENREVIFPLQLNPYSEIAAIATWFGQKEGGLDKLRGKKIVTMYHGSPYGKETIPILDLYAKKYRFEITHIEVPHPGNDQQSQWLNIRRIKPDWVILRGWGVMNPVAIKTAAKTGFPVDHIIGNIWSNAEEDVRLAGAVGKGYIAITTGPSGTNFPVLKDIERHVVKELGALGLLQPIKLSCSDHEGGGAVRFQQRDGQKWATISGWSPS